MATSFRGLSPAALCPSNRDTPHRSGHADDNSRLYQSPFALHESPSLWDPNLQSEIAASSRLTIFTVLCRRRRWPTSAAPSLRRCNSRPAPLRVPRESARHRRRAAAIELEPRRDRRLRPRHRADRLSGPRRQFRRKSSPTTRATSGTAAAWSRTSRSRSATPASRSARARSAFGRSASGTRTGNARRGASRPTGRWAFSSPADWHAKWIGLDGDERSRHARRHQLDLVPRRQADESRARRRPLLPPHVRRCRPIARSSGRRYLATADNQCKAFINGRDIGGRDNYRTVKDSDLTHDCKPGKNLLAVHRHEQGRRAQPGGHRRHADDRVRLAASRW